MTRDQALLIRQWRCSDHCSWRMVAQKAMERWPHANYGDGQLDGRYICEEAAVILGEDPMQNPWN